MLMHYCPLLVVVISYLPSTKLLLANSWGALYTLAFMFISSYHHMGRVLANPQNPFPLVRLLNCDAQNELVRLWGLHNLILVAAWVLGITGFLGFVTADHQGENLFSDGFVGLLFGSQIGMMLIFTRLIVLFIRVGRTNN